MEPKDDNHFGSLRTKATPHFKKDCSTRIYSVAAYMHHYPSHAANDVDPSDDKDMLLIGTAKDIAFNCLLVTLYNLLHAPHIQRATVPFFPSPSFPKDSHHRGATSYHQRRVH